MKDWVAAALVGGTAAAVGGGVYWWIERHKGAGAGTASGATPTTTSGGTGTSSGSATASVPATGSGSLTYTGGGAASGASSALYPVAFLVADEADLSLAIQSGIPAAALYYIGSDPFLSQAGQGKGYSAPSQLPLYTGASDQPAQVVLIGLAAYALSLMPPTSPYAQLVRQRAIATLQGINRVGTQAAIQAWVAAHAALLQPGG